MIGSHAGYLAPIFDENRRKDFIKWAKREIKKQHLDYDGIVISTGVSGIMGAILAHELNVPLIVARTSRVKNHSCFKVENTWPNMKLLFVDDLVDTGKTKKRVISRLKQEEKTAKVIATMVYKHWSGYYLRKED